MVDAMPRRRPLDLPWADLTTHTRGRPIRLGDDMMPLGLQAWSVFGGTALSPNVVFWLAFKSGPTQTANPS